jgi:hydrophobic/amphiphilic exporter-1 (mainly G- bacteria), HAE1 family
MNDALRQLGIAVALSVFLIFITMVLQFGDVMNSLLVLVSIPLGFIGALLSLFIFQSTLSLNSVLGVILLNGIAVANSIILVDFLKRLVDAGVKPERAALEAAKKRMRPILMTSLTTGLGMLPIALGLGDGGRILQPLGIAVIGGLGFSTFMTLFIVPALQASYLQWQHRRDEESEWLDDSQGLEIESILESGEKKKPAREELEEGLASS